MNVSLGLGLTNDCNLRCPHCYRPESPAKYLPMDDVMAVCESLDPGGVNLGTGENGLHPEFAEIVSWLLDRGYRVSLVSNGLSVDRLPDAEIERLADVEISIDFPDRERFDAFRGKGAWEAAVGALERCASIGVPRTVLAVLMRENHRDLPALAALAARFGAPLRVNVFQPVKSVRFLPTFDEFWTAVADLFEHTTLLACSEPVVCAAADLPNDGVRCGRTSIRVTPGGDVLPCVYWPSPTGTVRDVAALGREVFEDPRFQTLKEPPADCEGCWLRERCGGGCASRRLLVYGGLDAVDPFCPRRAHVELPTPRLASDASRLHVGNVCTLLVRA